MIKTLIVLLLISTPAYSATGKGEIGITLHTSVFAMEYEELKEFCEDYEWEMNCQKALDRFDENKKPIPQEINVFEGGIVIE